MGAGGAGGTMGVGGGGTGGAGGGNVDACTDGIQNGDETDIDCGGSCTTDCANGLNCAGNGDCTSGMCYAGECVASVNGCTIAPVGPPEVTFAGTTYTPKCLTVSAGTDVTFTGNFSSHPLLGGVPGAHATSGPFYPVTDTGTTKTVTLSTPGTYPYVCTVHEGAGMTGAIFVVP